MLFEEDGTPTEHAQSDIKAVKWWKKAAAQKYGGHKNYKELVGKAQFKLGVFC